MSITVEEVERRYPVHWLVWNNEFRTLQNAISENEFTVEDLELKDPHGRTPLLLAVTLGHLDTVTVLIEAGVNIHCEKDGWTAIHEATATGDARLLSIVLNHRDNKRYQLRLDGIPDLLNKLSMAPDFYVEMKWEFTSWVPLVSRMCPSDTYKVYKRGANVRVDTTLMGFDQNRWQHGDRTFIFRGKGKTATLVEVNHSRGTVWREELDCARPAAPAAAPAPRALRRRLRQPVVINYLDTDKINFERSKSGVWGWRQDKMESVNGYECKVFGANNVELVTKTRSEHLPRGARAAPRAPLAGLLALAGDGRGPEAEPAATGAAADLPTLLDEESPASTSSEEERRPVTWAEYFSGEDLGERDVGVRKEISTKVQKFRANMWLCEDYPLELQEQIMPILDLMASMSSTHFAKLKDFIQLQLPSGFPVKIEIPLYHVLNARITFGNIFATESGAPHVQCVAEGARLACVVDDACFAAPRGYRDLAAGAGARLDDDEGLLQLAIEQSLADAGGALDDKVDVWEALRGAPAAPREPHDDLLAHEERQLQKAIEASLALVPSTRVRGVSESEPSDVSDASEVLLRRALELSTLEDEANRQRALEEQRQLEEALRLSLLDD